MVVFLLLSLLLPALVPAFNLDAGNVVVWSGEPGSLFGFSLAMHRQLEPRERRLLLVGAPRQKAFPSQLANRTGGLYSCDILTPDLPCTRIKFDEQADPRIESKEDQWMGVTVRSQGPGGKVVTCAHRYEKRQYVNTVQETRDIIGRCYVLSQELTMDDVEAGEWRFCDGRLRGHEKFGSCQQGVAATFTRDFHYVVFGAPGTYNWKGVVRAEQKNHTFYDRGIYDDGPYEVGDESHRDESLVPVPANSYLVATEGISLNIHLLLLLDVMWTEEKTSTFVCLIIGDIGLISALDRNMFAVQLDEAKVTPTSFNAALGLLFMTSVSYANPDQFVYKTLPPNVRAGTPNDVMMNSYLVNTWAETMERSSNTKEKVFKMEPLKKSIPSTPASHLNFLTQDDFLSYTNGEAVVKPAKSSGDMVACGFPILSKGVFFHNVCVDKLEAFVCKGVDEWSLWGFSLDSGKGIVSQENVTFVSGAPRANHSGAVVLLKKDSDLQRSLSLVHVFEGEGLASSFGYDVAAVDLNSDGWQDIVVGAPQYFDRDGEIGGAVYVYINQQGKWQGVKPIRLNGTANSMFGIAVANIGDINQDGFPDIAVGAPYDGDFGKVYIYHGSKNGINIKPTQILNGEANRIPFFGYSITGNMDLDQNSYPDIAVGSLSDSVSVYRSKPVVNIKKTIEISPNRIDLNKKNCHEPSGICMNVKACFEYTASSKDFNPKLILNYTFEAENERRRLGLPSRVQFSRRSSDQLSGSVTLAGQKKEECVTTTVVLQEKIKDKLRPIPITVGVEINGSDSSLQSRRRQGRSLPDLVPILNSNEPRTVHSEVQFLKEGCGSDNVCHSNLKLHYRFCTKEGSEDKFAYFPMENNVPLLILKDQKDIALEITVTNSPSDPRNLQKDGEDAHEAKLIATFPDSLTYSAFREYKGFPEKQLTCGANPNGSQVECELGNPFRRNSNVTFYVILSTTKVNVDTKDLDINLKLETTSNQVNLDPITASAKVVIELLLSLTGVAKPSQIYFGGKVIGESAMESEDDIGSLIEYEFRITNLGRPLKTFGTASLDILWPKELRGGKWLMYLISIHSKELGQLQCDPPQEINPLKIELSRSSRTKREVAEKQTEGGKSFSLFSERKYKTLECDVEANCVRIRCPLQGLDSKATVALRSRLWNSTFLEEYSKMNYLDIPLKATISIDDAADNIKLSNEATNVRVTVFPAKTVALYKGIPWWIILVAVLAGLLMLSLLVFLLWKCGFFKRNKKDHYDATYHKAEIHTQPSDKERLTSDA